MAKKELDLEALKKRKQEIEAKAAKDLSELFSGLAEREQEAADDLKAVGRLLLEAGQTPKYELVPFGKAKGGKGGAMPSGKSIRWGSKNNTWIADFIAKNGATSMADLKAAAAKSKLSELSIYQAARTLVKAGGLSDNGGTLSKGPSFRESQG